jgi:hypothetical protein
MDGVAGEFACGLLCLAVLCIVPLLFALAYGREQSDGAAPEVAGEPETASAGADDDA